MSVNLLVLLLAPLILFVVYVKQKYSFWSRQNVPYIEPRFPFGNFRDANTKSAAELSLDHYSQMKTKGRFYGLYFFLQPLVTIIDLDLIKTILIKDFNQFPNRGVYHNPRDDPLSAHLVALDGSKWRSLRTRLTPTFTSGKMKMMFSALKTVGDNFSEVLVAEIGEGAELEVKDYLSRFTTDVIGSCAFGINCNSFKDRDNQFRKLGRQIFENPKLSALQRIGLLMFPKIGRLLRIKALNSEATSFVYNLVESMVSLREKDSIERNDFLSLLIAMKSSGEQLTMNEIAAQSTLFFSAGFETSSSNQTYCLYELSLNQACQDKARKCVLEAIEKHGGLSYEAVCDMQYIDQCINETLRMYPPFPVLGRMAVQNYRIPDTDVIIPKGTRVQIPSFAIHLDERYYPKPEVFDPDRFNPEQVAKRHAFSFLPFGEGPRNCIALRFGMMQSRVGLATVLRNFRFSACPRTIVPLEYSSSSLVLQPKNGVWLKVEPLHGGRE